MSTTDLEPADWQILHILAEDARVGTGDVAEETGLTEREVALRIERLRERGVVVGMHARVDPSRLGLPLTAFFMVRVAQTAEAYQAIDVLVRDIDQVEEAHAVSGQFDWILKVRAAGPDDLRELLTTRLALLPGFVRAETMVVMSTSCDAVNVDAALHPRAT
jgi:DNA-binding Lrp family transcriptional regulator